MMELLLMSLMSATSLSFMFSLHPLRLILSLILQTLLISFTLFLHSAFSWFSFMLALVFLSGMVVVIMYMASVSANELFPLNLRLLCATFACSYLTLAPIFTRMQGMQLDLMLYEQELEVLSKPFSSNLYSLILILGVFIVVTLFTSVMLTTSHSSSVRHN